MTKSSGSGKGQKKVRVTRRRDSTRDGERRRAEAPRRRKEEARGEAPPRRRTSGSGGSGRQLPPAVRRLPGGGNRQTLTIVIFVLVVGCYFLFTLISGPDESGGVDFAPLDQASEPDTELPALVQPTEPVEPAEPAEPLVLPPVSSDGQTWLVMLYQDADDKILEQDIYVDLNEAERVGSTDRVHIVAQVDRYRAGYQGDGNWATAKRFYVTQDDDLERVRSQELEDLGEVNMADGDTLVDFVNWATEMFPADKHVLIMSDHGMGWPGGWSDPAPGARGDASIPLAAALGDELYLMEIDASLETIRQQSGVDKFELIGMDACLMGHLEVFSALAPHARYSVASQETEPALGWAYTGFLSALVANPDMGGGELGGFIVDSYIEDDQRIVDDQARAELLRKGGSPLGGIFGLFGTVSAAQVAQQMDQNTTLAAIDLQALPPLMDSLNNLSYALQEGNQPGIAEVRTYAQSFTSVFGGNVPPSYIDLGNFVQLLAREQNNSVISRAADEVLAALDNAVIAERHGPKKPGATGISIYFPNSQLYQSPVTGPESYTAIASRFAAESLWDDFLTYHYTGRGFGPAPAAASVPQRGTTVSAPGAGRIELGAISLSDNVAAPGRPVLMSTEVSGQNIGYIFFFTGFYDESSNSIFMADTDYLESDASKEISGVYYPDWGDDAEFTMEFEWEPLMFAISDGVDSVLAMLTPQDYGATAADAIYTVEGIYSYGDGGETRYARLYFQDGVLTQVFGFTGQDGTGAPREIIPQSGDSFTVLERWMDLDSQGGVSQVSTQEGGTLTFGDQTLVWEELDAAVGQYIVGFIVEDLDGARTEVYTQVSVE